MNVNLIMLNAWAQAVSRAQGGEKVHYGVTFAAQGQEEDLRLLDDLLESYSFFSSPSLVHGDNQKETVERHLASKDDLVVDTRGATVVPASVVTGNGKQVHKYLSSQACTKLWDLNNF